MKYAEGKAIMEKTRLFIALDLSDPARKKVYEICDGIKGIRWTKRKQLHLTLSFIGDTDNKMIPQLSEALSRLKFKPFDLTISGTGFFRSNIFFLKIDESADLSALKKRIDVILNEILGYEPDKCKFIPHITLARFKRPLSSGKARFLTQVFAPVSLEKFSIDKFILYSSETESNGAIHTPLKVISANK